MTRSEREALADIIGRELANARAAWRKEHAIILAETRTTMAELRAEVSDLKCKIQEQAAQLKDGERGPQGERGEQGADGKQGEKGETGQAGERGERGEPGERGPAGERGSDGQNGKDGAPGAAGQLPLSRRWEDRIHYQGQVVTHKGSTWQALCDTAKEPGQEPGHDWQLLAQRGQDARQIAVLGTWSAEGSYAALDIVALNGGSFIATRNDPGPCPGDGWQLIARQGKPGSKGERGDKGERGERGPAGPGIDEARVLKMIRQELELYHEEVG